MEYRYMDQTQDYAMQLATGEEPMVKKMMGKDYKKFFNEYTEDDFREAEAQANYERDAKMGL